MDQLKPILDYFLTHPGAAAALVIGLGIAAYLLNQKPQYVRDADEQLRALRRESKYRDAH